MIRISPAELDSAAFVALIEAHKALMLEHSPPESSHALLIEGLKAPDVTVWQLNDDDNLIGCCALKELDRRHGEIKSMHTIASYRGQGLGKRMLEHLLLEARARGYRRLSLETGSMDGFVAARRLYEAYGFVLCGPFGDYILDPNSVFMTLEL